MHMLCAGNYQKGMSWYIYSRRRNQETKKMDLVKQYDKKHLELPFSVTFCS